MLASLPRAFFAIALLGSVGASAAAAHPGDIDRTIPGARALLAVGATASSQAGIRIVPAGGGGVFVLTTVAREGLIEPAVARIKANGSLDPTFGDQGVAYLKLGRVDAPPRALLRQADDELAVGATASDGARRS